MKKVVFLIAMALAAFTFAPQTASAQITMLGSVDGVSSDTLVNANTIYFTTPAAALNNYNTGKYRVSFHCANVSGTSTFKVILQGTIDGTNWVNMTGLGGTDGINCDTLQVTSASPADFIFNCVPGVGKTYTSALYSVYTSGATFQGRQGRVIRLRLAFVGTGTQSTYISGVKCLVQQ